MTGQHFPFGHPPRWEKLLRQLSQKDRAEILRWAREWMYWNTQLYRLHTTGAHLSHQIHLDDLRLWLKIHRHHKKYGITEPIIVYSVPKVGSTTVFRSLQALDLDVPIYHLHFLADFETVANWARNSLAKPAKTLRVIEKAKHVRQEIDAAPQKKWNLINLVRLPVPRLISNFWENIESNVPNFRTRLASGTVSVSEIINLFLANNLHDWVSYWYDIQIKDIFGIDVFAEPFARARGYQIFNGVGARLLLMRLEDLDHIASPAMQDFLAIPKFVLYDKNVGAKKLWGGLYQSFLDELRLPAEFIAKQHETRYAQHFYTPAELEASVQKWRQ